MTTRLPTVRTSKRVKIGAREAYYTICPVFVASHIAVEFGWLEEEFIRIGAKLSYLRGLDPSVGWLPHFNHTLDHLFRDGGNIPSISARADVTDTLLIGLTAGHHGGSILVRQNADIHRVADLAGKKFGLYRSLNKYKVDWWRATGHRGLDLALNLAGLSKRDIQVVDIETQEQAVGGARRPSELWSDSRRAEIAFTPEVKALAEGKVDAVYTSEGRALRLQRTGAFKVIEDFSRYPDWTLQVANSPYAITVNADFAQKNRDIIVAFLRATVRAGHWANANRDAAASILARVTYYPTIEDIATAIRHVDFVPNLSPLNLAAVDVQKAFLVQEGYIQNDFAVADWADASFLEEAHVKPNLHVAA